ncbi:hypothetical protein HDU98_001125 [Podochytrium sp. JEL0797]|nr:hypothetical protein HDU98_001125 [Podochytrium sp. JEL0797]
MASDDLPSYTKLPIRTTTSATTSRRRLRWIIVTAIALFCICQVYLALKANPSSVQDGLASLTKSLHGKQQQHSNAESGRISDDLRDAVEDAVEKAVVKAFQGVSPEVQQRLDKIYVPPRQDIPLKELETSIDLMQARFLDYLNGEEPKTRYDLLSEPPAPKKIPISSPPHSPSTVFGGSLLDLDAPFNVRTTFNRVHQYARLIANTTTYNRKDFIALGRRSRAQHIAYKLLHDQPSLVTLLALSISPNTIDASESRRILELELNEVVDSLTANLYKWIQGPEFTSIRAMQERFLDPQRTPDMGIVFSVGVWHFELATVGIMALREVLGCSLPIEVHYLGVGDLTQNMLDIFDAMPGVTTVNIYSRLPNIDVEGWAIKPFSILAANFRNVLFIDADALFFQNPEVIVRQSQIYKEFGQLFYHDRSLVKDQHLDWFLKIDPEMSKYAAGLRYTNGLSTHEMESGVVVVDKGRTGILHALILTCQMNDKEERSEAYNHMHGDKETFWMSWDLVRTPYRFTPNYGGAVGYRNTTSGNVCGGLYHTDEYNQPAWWNGGVLNNKYASMEDDYMQFEYVATDSYGYDVEWEWDWATQTTPFCLRPRDPLAEIRELPDYQKDIGNEYVETYKDIRGMGWKEYFASKLDIKLNMKEPLPKKHNAVSPVEVVEEINEVVMGKLKAAKELKAGRKA